MRLFLFITIIIPLSLYADGSSFKSNTFGGNNNVGFESYSGDKYQYDLNSPVDRIRYGVDIQAQQRDKMERLVPNPKREILEETFGQTGRGGGIYRK